MTQYQIDEVQDFVDGGRKQLKISTRQNPVVVYGGTWKLLLDHGAQEVTRMLLQGEVSGKEMGFFLHLVQEMGPGNTVQPSQKALAERFGVSVSYISRVLRGLKAVGLIRDGMINPTIVTKGRTEDYAATLQRWNAAEPAGPLEFGKGAEPQSSGDSGNGTVG